MAGAEPRTPDFWLSDLCIYQTQGPGWVDSTPSPSSEAFGDKNGVLWGLLAGQGLTSLACLTGSLRLGLLWSEGARGLPDSGLVTLKVVEALQGESGRQRKREPNPSKLM